MEHGRSQVYGSDSLHKEKKILIMLIKIGEEDFWKKSASALQFSRFLLTLNLPYRKESAISYVLRDLRSLLRLNPKIK